MKNYFKFIICACLLCFGLASVSFGAANFYIYQFKVKNDQDNRNHLYFNLQNDRSIPYVVCQKNDKKTKKEIQEFWHPEKMVRMQQEALYDYYELKCLSYGELKNLKPAILKSIGSDSIHQLGVYGTVKTSSWKVRNILLHFEGDKTGTVRLKAFHLEKLANQGQLPFKLKTKQTLQIKNKSSFCILLNAAEVTKKGYMISDLKSIGFETVLKKQMYFNVSASELKKITCKGS